MGKGFGSPAQFRGDDKSVRTALIENWRALVTYINSYVPSYDAGTNDLTLPDYVDIVGDLDVGGDLDVTGTISGLSLIDHGSGLEGQADDDHTQYSLVDGTRGALIAMDTHTDLADYANVPATETITHTKTVAVGAASATVYVDMTISVRWKGMTAGATYIYVRPSVNGVAQGNLMIEMEDVTLYKTLVQRYCGPFTANGSGDIVLGTSCYSSSAVADIDHIQIAYQIWAR